MKKLYRKGTVHPTPPVVSDQLLSFLPAAILTMTVALSPEEREVLAYLISCSSANFSNFHLKTSNKASVAAALAGGSKSSADHPSSFSCNCFRCYMGYWAKWDSSPNRQLIHEIIDAFEESLLKESKNEKNKKERKKGKTVKQGNIGLGLDGSNKAKLCPNQEDISYGESSSVAEGRGETVGGGEAEEEDAEKGSVRRLMDFLGERIWSVWG